MFEKLVVARNKLHEQGVYSTPRSSNDLTSKVLAAMLLYDTRTISECLQNLSPTEAKTIIGDAWHMFKEKQEENISRSLFDHTIHDLRK